jgi:hypothetical protein
MFCMDRLLKNPVRAIATLPLLPVQHYRNFYSNPKWVVDAAAPEIQSWQVVACTNDLGLLQYYGSAQIQGRQRSSPLYTFV